jgi:NAD(P)-dependent dehydrogenase (short-subunit alcohol dehydrogenase family)
MIVGLQGRVLLVTGSTQGLGRKIAELAVASGVEAVMISGRDEAKGRAVADALSGGAARVAFRAIDLAAPDAAAWLVRETIEVFGRIDLLVNAAGLTDRASILDGSLELWDRLMAVNARAPYFLMQAAVADMMARGAGGSIVNILSINAHCGSPELAIYSATKGALATLTRNVANACLSRGIRVNGINMGWAPTAAEHVMQGQILGGGADWLDRAAQSMPLKRLLSEDEVASLAIYMLSDTAGLLTGTLVDLEQYVLGAPANAKGL